jgi:hypothetical protein
MNRVTCLALAAAFGAACSSGGTPEQPADAVQPGHEMSDRSATGTSQGGEVPGSALTTSTSAPAGTPQLEFRDVTVPSGTTLTATLATAVASDTSKAEDPVRATLAKPIVVDGAVIVPEGAELSGIVLEADQSGRVKGRASIAFRFDRLLVGRETHDISTARIARQAEATKGEDAMKVGIGAGAGAVVGAIAGGKKGALIGGAVGAGAGTGVVLATRGEEVRLAVGSTVSTTLAEPVTIQVPSS